MYFQTFLILLLNQAFHIKGQNCGEFTLGNFDSKDNLIWSNDLVKTSELCQDICRAFSDCQFFKFYQGVCRLYRYLHLPVVV